MSANPQGIAVPIQQHAAETLNEFKINESPLISISARRWSRFERGSETAYFDAVADTAESLIEQRDATIVFASTCTGLAGYHTDDRVAAQEIISRMDTEVRDSVMVLTGEYSPYRLMEIYGEMDLHIGTRMHSNILAILGGTVPVPIEYQFKTTGLMKIFGLEDHVLDIDGLVATALKEQVNRSLNNREEIASRIEIQLPEIRAQARQNAELVQVHVNIT